MLDLNALRDHKDSFIEHCCIKKVPFVPKGILNIEAFYWWALVGHYQPDLILESGVAMGRSTEVLARAQQFFKVKHHYAFDPDHLHKELVTKKLEPYNTHYKIQDSFRGFRITLKELKNPRCLVIIDGPKGAKPISQLILSLATSKCCAIASHDCMPGSKIPDVFFKACRTAFPQSDVIITSPEMNVGLEDLNSYIVDDVLNAKLQKFGDDAEEMTQASLNRSHYVGLCAIEP